MSTAYNVSSTCNWGDVVGGVALGNNSGKVGDTGTLCEQISGLSKTGYVKFWLITISGIIKFLDLEDYLY